MVTCREMQTDVLVIVGGAAGMMASIQAAKAGCNVLMITDGACASTGILGFNALVSEADSRERFCGDIIQGGWELSDPNLVEVFVDGTSRAVRDLEEMGVSFDRTPDGSYHLLQPLGCSVPRLVHSENKTGTCSLAAMRAGMNNLGVTVWEHTVACGLRCSDGRVTGACAYSSTQKQPWCIRAKAVVIATGGGAVLRPENVDALRQNAYVIHISRPVSSLPTDGRPLSKDLTTLMDMEKARMPLYEAASDMTFDNSAERTKKQLIAAVQEALEL